MKSFLIGPDYKPGFMRADKRGEGEVKTSLKIQARQGLFIR